MKLTKRQREILEYLVHPYDDHHDGQLVGECGQWWFGLERTSWRTVRPLLQNCLLREESERDDTFQIYVANEETEFVLKDENYVPLIQRTPRWQERKRTGELK